MFLPINCLGKSSPFYDVLNGNTESGILEQFSLWKYCRRSVCQLDIESKSELYK